MDPMRDADLYRGLEEKLGTTVATSLMERLPPAPPDRLATKDDVAVVSGDVTAVRGELTAFRTEVDRRFDKVDQRFDKMDERLRVTEVSFEKLDGRLAKMQAELLAAMRGEMISAIHTQGRQLAWTLFGSLMSLSALAYLFGTFAG